MGLLASRQVRADEAQTPAAVALAPQPATVAPAPAGSPSERPRPHGAPLYWQPGWERFNSLDLGLSIGGAVVALGGLVLGPGDRARHYETGVDASVRNALRADSRSLRVLARDTSDITVAGLASYPVLVDALVNAAWYRDSPDLAEQLAMMDLEVFAVVAAMTSAAKAAAARERPYGQECGGELDEQTTDCRTQDRYFSHFSGHASAGFAAASITCVHHHYLPLWGSVSPWVPCSAAYTLAAATAMLRVVSDMHYITDVGIGAFVGTGVGLLIPWLHYRSGGVHPGREPSAEALEPPRAWWVRHRIQVAPTPRGFQLGGVF